VERGAVSARAYKAPGLSPLLACSSMTKHAPFEIDKSEYRFRNPLRKGENRIRGYE
jgi:hypothetical protein